jgi:hypothetical protein
MLSIAFKKIVICNFRRIFSCFYLNFLAEMKFCKIGPWSGWSLSSRRPSK